MRLWSWKIVFNGLFTYTDSDTDSHSEGFPWIQLYFIEISHSTQMGQDPDPEWLL